MATTSRAIRSRIASGTPGGPNTQSHEVWSTPGTPASAMVGTFGIDGSRRELATASIFSRGFSAWPAPTAELIMCASIVPASRSVVACDAALVLHVLHRDAGLLHEHLADEMGEAAVAGGAEVERAGPRLGVGDELGERVDRQILLHHQDRRPFRHHRDRHVVAQRIERIVLLHGGGRDVGADRAHLQRVAVGLRLQRPRRCRSRRCRRACRRPRRSG